MSKYANFRNHTNLEVAQQNDKISDFIEKHLSSTLVSKNDSATLIKAVLTKTHKEGNEETLLFTYPKEGVKVGDYILHESRRYLTFMEYIIPLKQHYRKHSLVYCNVTLGFGNIKIGGAYRSSLRSFTDAVTQNEGSMTFEADLDKPVVIAANNVALKVNDRVMVNSEAFLVKNIDRMSNAGIMYLSIEPAPHNPLLETQNGESTIIPAAPQPAPVDNTKLQAGIKLSLNIVGGYVKFVPAVDIISRTINKVEYIIPYGVEQLTIVTKNSQGTIVKTIKEVV